MKKLGREDEDEGQTDLPGEKHCKKQETMGVM